MLTTVKEDNIDRIKMQLNEAQHGHNQLDYASMESHGVDIKEEEDLDMVADYELDPS